MLSLISQNMLNRSNSVKKSVILARSSKDIFNNFSKYLDNVFKTSSQELCFRDYTCRILYIETSNFSVYCFLINIRNSIIKHITRTSCLLIVLITYHYSLFLNPRGPLDNIKRLIESILSKVFKMFDDVEFAYNLSPEIFFDRLENLLLEDEPLTNKFRKLTITYLLYPLKVYYYITIIECVISCFRDVISSSLLRSRDLIFFLKEFNDYASTILRIRVNKIIALFSAYASLYVSLLVLFFKFLFTKFLFTVTLRILSRILLVFHLLLKLLHCLLISHCFVFFLGMFLS